MEGRTVRLRPIGRPYGSFTARWKAVRFILRTVSRAYGQLRAPHFGRISYVFPLCFIVLSLRISLIFYGFIFIYFAFYSFTKANYGGYIQAVLFFKYHQCIIIAPTVVPRNFLCIFCFTVLFLMYFLLYFTVLLKLLRRLYTGGSIFQVPPVSDYIT